MPGSPTTRSSRLTTADIPTRPANAPIVGESSIHTLDDLKSRRARPVYATRPDKCHVSHVVADTAVRLPLVREEILNSSRLI